MQRNDFLIHKTELSSLMNKGTDEVLNGLIEQGYSIIYNEPVETRNGVHIYFYLHKPSRINYTNLIFIIVLYIPILASLILK